VYRTSSSEPDSHRVGWRRAVYLQPKTLSWPSRWRRGPHTKFGLDLLKMWPYIRNVGTDGLITQRFAFYPRDAMLARLLAMALCLCLPVTSRSSVETDEWIELVFVTGASFHLSYIVLKEIRVSLSRTPVVCFGISIAETCYRLSLTKLDAQSVIDWTVVGQLSWQYLRVPTLDH